MKRSRFLVLALLVLAGGARAQADTATIAATKDNTLYDSATGDLSNGAGALFFTGTSGAALRRRGVLAFDVAGAVPAGATITAVTLTLEMVQTSSGPHPAALHRLTADWGEGASVAGGNGGAGGPSAPGDATWIHSFFPSDLWATAGGDFVPTESAMQTVGAAGPYSWNGAGMVADVQAWLDAPAGNFGWILVGNESVAQTTKGFGTKDNANPALQPVLQIEFDPGSPVPAMGKVGTLVLALLLAGLATRSMRRRARHL